MRTTLFHAAILLTLASCGGSPPPAVEAPPAPSATPAPTATASTSPPEAAPAPAPSAAPAPPPAAEATPTWREDWSKEEKMSFMKQRVMPRMKTLFQEHDGKHFAEFTCKTCHGPLFKSPKSFLPKLRMTAAKAGGHPQLEAFVKEPKVAKFMAEKVVPEMASLMGQKPYDPQTQQGFGCGGCHTIVTK